MKIINATGDQAITKLKQGDWYVHTIFEHTFNLTDRNHLPLILITSQNGKQLPGGLYLPRHDFDELLSQLPMFNNIKLENNVLSIETERDYWHIIIKNRYQVKLQPSVLRPDRVTLMLSACNRLERLTGFNKPFHDFLKSNTTPFYNEINWLMDDATISKAIDFFIGRGRGLTPAGDDFILGWLLVDQLRNRNLMLAKHIEEKISSTEYTTDISRSYLSWAIEGSFSSALLDIIDYLNGVGPDDCIDRLLKNAIDYGNTSGTDTLSGLVTALIFQK